MTEFRVAPDLKGGPISPEEVLSNIRKNAERELPVFRKCKPHGGTLIFVGGGPSLLKHLEELRGRKEPVMTSNMTHDFLLEQGIRPSMVLFIDPKDSAADYIQNYQKDCQYYFSALAAPRLYQKAAEAGVTPTKVLVAYGLDDESDVKAQTLAYNAPGQDFLVGGTMTPLRAMNFAVMLGYAKVEFYGFDSCYGSSDPEIIPEDSPEYASALAGGAVIFKDADTGVTGVVKDKEGFFYAYRKLRQESIEIAKTADGRTFLTSPGFAHQAKQLIKWVDRLEGKLDIVIHGDSLNSHMLRLHREWHQRQKDKIGDRRWTEEYGQMQRELHDTQSYGLWGDHDLELLGRTILGLYHHLRRPLTFMDYGAGSGALGAQVEALFRAVSVTNYDPFHPRWRDKPEPGVHDVVNCADVLEHVEPQCIDNTLKYIAAHTRYGAVFSVALEEAKKTLPDGRNAHITLRSAQWWHKKLSEHFVVAEARTNGDAVVLVCQKADAAELLAQERMDKAA